MCTGKTINGLVRIADGEQAYPTVECEALDYAMQRHTKVLVLIDCKDGKTRLNQGQYPIVLGYQPVAQKH